MNYLDILDCQTYVSEADVYISQIELLQKQLIMEQETSDGEPKPQSNDNQSTDIGTAPDPVSKWQQFVNWITRLIMKLRTFFLSKKVEKRIGKLKDAHRYLSDNDKDTYTVPAYVEVYWKAVSEIIWLDEFSVSKGKEYQKHAAKVEKDMAFVKKYSSILTGENDKTININKRQFALALTNIEKLFNNAKEYISKANSSIKSLKGSLSEEDRKSPAFQQYVNCLTKGIQMYFYYMKFINKTLLWIMEDENIFTATLDGKYSHDAGGGISGLYDAVAISAIKAKISREQVKSYKTIYVFLKDNDMLVAFSNAKDANDTDNMKVVNLTLASHYDYNTLPDQAIKQLKNRDIFALDSDKDRERIISKMPGGSGSSQSPSQQSGGRKPNKNYRSVSKGSNGLYEAVAWSCILENPTISVDDIKNSEEIYVKLHPVAGRSNDELMVFVKRMGHPKDAMINKYTNFDYRTLPPDAVRLLEDNKPLQISKAAVINLIEKYQNQ